MPQTPPTRPRVSGRRVPRRPPIPPDAPSRPARPHPRPQKPFFHLDKPEYDPAKPYFPKGHYLMGKGKRTWKKVEAWKPSA